jgi:2-keto-3-deoxy-L-rhamnonate aldolase RhmA
MFAETSVRRRLEAGENQSGLFMNLGNFVAAELAGRAGFDVLVLDQEHSPWDYVNAIHAMNAVRGTGSEVWVRIPGLDQAYIKRILDCGATGVMCPMIGTREEAERFVSYCRYAPHGIRGYAPTMTRHTGYGYERDEYFRRVDADLAIMAQIETRDGVDNAEAIAAVEGLDIVFIGPMDLSKSLGRTGEFSHPEVVAAVRRIEDAVRKAGKILGTLALPGQDLAGFLERGYRFVIVGADLGILRSGLEALAKAVKAANEKDGGKAQRT